MCCEQQNNNTELDILKKTLAVNLETWELFNRADFTEGEITGYRLFLLISLDRAYKYCESVFLLCEKGFVTESIPIIRTLFELYISVKFIHQNKDQLDRYIDFQWIRRKRFLDILTKDQPKRAHSSQNYTSDEIVRYAASAGKKHKFKNKNNWWPKGFRDACSNVGEEKDYNIVYRYLSDYCHSNVMTVLDYDFVVNKEKKLAFVKKQKEDSQSISAASMLRVMLEFFEEEYKLGTEAKLAHLFDIINDYKNTRG